MRGSKKDLPKLINTDGVIMQEAEWEDMPVEYDVFQGFRCYSLAQGHTW